MSKYITDYERELEREEREANRGVHRAGKPKAKHKEADPIRAKRRQKQRAKFTATLGGILLLCMTVQGGEIKPVKAEGIDKGYSQAALSVYADRYMKSGNSDGVMYDLRGAESTEVVDNARLVQTYYAGDSYIGEYRTESGIKYILSTRLNDAVYVCDLYSYTGNKGAYKGAVPSEVKSEVIPKYEKILSSELELMDYKECSTRPNGESEYCLLELKGNEGVNYVVYPKAKPSESHML